MAYAVAMVIETPTAPDEIRVETKIVSELFDTLGMALARASYMDYCMPMLSGATRRFIVYDAMGGQHFPGDEWRQMVDVPTFERLFPLGFPSAIEYTRRDRECLFIYANVNRDA